MSDNQRADDEERIFRIAVTPWPTGIRGRFAAHEPAIHVPAPGRGWLELSVLLAAFAILAPACAVGSAGFALVARRASNSRWAAALVAAVWCGFLGFCVRTALGFPVAP
jgi:hypothetical protein